MVAGCGPSAKSAREHPSSSHGQSGRMTMAANNTQVDILLIEDTPTDAELCIRALKKHNLANRLVWVKDGAEALDFLFSRGDYVGRKGNGTLKLILLDLKLPKIDGLDVLRAIRGDETLKATPVVILTSSQEARDLIESYKLGANSYVSKPIEFDEFSEAVAHLGLY